MSESSSAASMVDQAKRWIKLLEQGSGSPSIRVDERTINEFFSNAQNFAINGGQFINEMKVNYINDVVSNRQAVFKSLEPYTCLDATKDSSARYPPPKCHPQTRLRIRERLAVWLSNEHEEKMLWVRGSAGTGKSAVAQSFGDSCEEEQNLGGSYFFSRVANRNKLETVTPTLIYQLAENVPEYCSLIGQQLAETPSLVQKSLPVQFRKLIAEPFAVLQRQRSRKPIVVILDGLDECDGDDAQLEIIEMITNTIHSYPDLPLRWLIFSRPEAHLKHAFSRNLICGREALIIDAECRENVEQYVKDRLAKIKDTYQDTTPADWPPPDKLEELLDIVSGLFVLASTCLNFIADPNVANPPSHLNYVLTFLRRSQGVVSRSPLAALDLLYLRILEKIPSTAFKTTRQILGYMSHRSTLERDRGLRSTQTLCNYLRLDQHTFYNAVRWLHSVMDIPEPQDAAKSQLRFYHASFHDFLLNPNRSSKFAISEQDALLDILPFGIYWCEVDATHFHTDEGPNLTYYGHKHDILPGLTWVSEDNQRSISDSILDFIERSLLYDESDMELDSVNDGLLSQLSNINFRYWYYWNVFSLVRLCQLDPSTSVVRVEPSDPMDHQLLEYFNVIIENGISKPAKFPLKSSYPKNQWVREYFFVGCGVKSVIIWTTMAPTSSYFGVFSFSSEQEPSERQKNVYSEYLQHIKWDEEEAKLEMK